jgi:Domain of unknown function (DUF1887)
MFNVHVCLVSQQAAPNFLPLLDEALKPKEVILLVTEKMQAQATYLQKVIKPLGIKVVIHDIEAAGDFQKTQEQLMSLLSQYDPADIALNATGGTKWMAITAQEVFRMNGSPVFYVDIATGSVLFLDSQRAPHTLAKKVKLESYINAYGYNVKNEEKIATGLTGLQRDLYQTLIKNVVEWGGALGQLNALASAAEKKKTLTIKLSDECPYEDPYLEKLLKECEFSNLLTVKNGLVTFTSDSARFEANGGWLENYINSKLNELKADGTLQDRPHLNIQVSSPGNSPNEVDIAFMANNKLHMVECKTKRLAGKQAGSAGTESLYKLDSISALGGLGTKSMLVSYRALNKYDAERAKDLRIKVVQAQDIHRMKDVLREWLQ